MSSVWTCSKVSLLWRRSICHEKSWPRATAAGWRARYPHFWNLPWGRCTDSIKTVSVDSSLKHVTNPAWHSMRFCSLYIIMKSEWARWRLKSPASRLFTQPFIQAQIRENIKAPRDWPLCGEFTSHWWIPRTKGQWRGKCFHLMTSSSSNKIVLKKVAILPWLDGCLYNTCKGLLWGT